MKTQQEVEKMKDDIQRKIESVSKEMSTGALVGGIWHEKRAYKLSLMAQYNILLEVLK